MQKLISFCVPCYNSEEYMRHCIDSLLTGGDEIEIFIINDGSKDGTSRIAHEYEKEHGNVTAVDKDNGGHGSGVNKGLELATGLYYKVVDSDDWLNAEGLAELLTRLRADRDSDTLCDLYITNFIYDKVSEGTQFVRKFRKNFPEGKVCDWEKVKSFHTSSVLLMHSLLYRTEKLRESGIVLPEHTFYVDNLFAYQPLPYIKSICYLDIDLYHYFIGREDQSVNADNIVKRYGQQIRIMKLAVSYYTYDELCSMSKGLKKYMKHCLAVLMTLTLMFTVSGRQNVPKRKQDLKELWSFIRTRDRKMYRFLRRSYPALVDWMPFKMRGRVLFGGYMYYRKKLKCS